jgi:hypothetical protein
MFNFFKKKKKKNQVSQFHSQQTNIHVAYIFKNNNNNKFMRIYACAYIYIIKIIKFFVLIK